MRIHDPFETIVQLETMLHRADSRHDATFLETVLHPLFREFGRSGREYDRAAIIEALASEEPSLLIWSQDFQIQQVDIRTVLLTYRSVLESENGELERYTNRSSVWLETSMGWQMVFHQGTPTDPFSKSQPNLAINTDAARPLS